MKGLLMVAILGIAFVVFGETVTEVVGGTEPSDLKMQAMATVGVLAFILVFGFGGKDPKSDE